MSYFKELSTSARLLDVFKIYPAPCLPLIEYHQRLLRGESPFSVGEREWMAACVSALNSCRYCAGVHAATARRFGVDEAVMRQLLEDPKQAEVPERMRPVFAYLKKLTECPSRILPEDAEAIFAAGWNDRALHDLVAIGALFNCMNRLVEGFGISADGAYFDESSERLASKEGYGALLKLLKSEATSIQRKLWS
ncbi:MAG: carboxymuconolactone decarboxylase family protein [Oceanipulchritudo sp.]